MSGWLVAGVSAAGGIGAVARFVVDGSLSERRRTTFPLPTLLINVTGSLLLGVLAGLVLFHDAARSWQVVLGTGWCGGFTTFSTTSVASVRLAQTRRPALAAVNALGTLAVSVAAAGVGLAITAR
jgi:CrcB protein